MKSTTWQDDHPWTHIDWELDDVTPYQLNWFWCNMEKGDYLWHPNQHKGFEWWISLAEAGGPLGSVHIAPQTWNDGVKIRPFIKFPKLEDVPDEMRDLIKYDHVVIAGAISILGDNVKPDDPMLGYRVHQWQKSDNGVRRHVVGRRGQGERRRRRPDLGRTRQRRGRQLGGLPAGPRPALPRHHRPGDLPRTTRSAWRACRGAVRGLRRDRAPVASRRRRPTAEAAAPSASRRRWV